MKKELGRKFYNDCYKVEPKYNTHYKNSPYFEMWESILNKVDDIADFGCGVGQFAQMAIDQGVKYSYGLDFSDTAIDRCKEINDRFYLRSLHDEDVYSLRPYKTAVLLEVLEHLDNDKEVLTFIPKGRNIVISVPNFDSEGHVRYFKDIEEVLNRYSIIDVADTETFDIGTQGKQIFVVYGKL